MIGASGGEPPTIPRSMSRTPDFTDYRYVGKEGKRFVVTDGLSVRYLDAREFQEFSKQVFGFAG